MNNKQPRGTLLSPKGARPVRKYRKGNTDRILSGALPVGEKGIIQMIANGKSLESVLNALVHAVRVQPVSQVCSVFMRDGDANELYYAAGAGIARDYFHELGNVPIGPSSASCGTAAFRNELVITSNIREDSLWVEYADLAQKYGLSACWSMPIVSTEGDVLGTFALYSPCPGEPRQHEIGTLHTLSSLAGIAIEKHMLKCEVEQLRFYDALTSLPNRLQFLSRLTTRLESEHGSDLGTLMHNANAALYASKSHPNSYRIYEPTLCQKCDDKLSMESDLRRAIANGELFLHYQPRLELHSGRVSSAEALIRWNHPTRGIVPPNEFIPLAEQTGMIVDIGQWVLEAVARQIKTWLEAGIHPVRVAVNVSPIQLQQTDFVQAVSRTMNRLQIDPKWLEIEITETALIDNASDAISKLCSLQKLGITISIDDFGIGYSSLGRLRRLPVNSLKIDQSFIRDLTPSDGAIVSTIITLGHNLNLCVIAEGVETEEQRTFLQTYGCDEFQGYLISRPIPVHEFENRFLRQALPTNA